MSVLHSSKSAPLNGAPKTESPRSPRSPRTSRSPSPVSSPMASPRTRTKRSNTVHGTLTRLRSFFNVDANANNTTDYDIVRLAPVVGENNNTTTTTTTTTSAVAEEAEAPEDKDTSLTEEMVPPSTNRSRPSLRIQIPPSSSSYPSPPPTPPNTEVSELTHNTYSIAEQSICEGSIKRDIDDTSSTTTLDSELSSFAPSTTTNTDFHTPNSTMNSPFASQTSFYSPQTTPHSPKLGSPISTSSPGTSFFSDDEYDKKSRRQSIMPKKIHEKLNILFHFNVCIL